MQGEQGMRRPTLSEVAAAAQVHPSTASRALNPALAGRLSAEVVDRVRQVAETLGYSRNAIAASLRTQASRMVGVIVPDLTNTMFPPMFRGIEDRLAKDGYQAMLANSDVRGAKEQAIIDTYLDRRVDGIILASAHLEDAAQLTALARKVPLVLMNRESGAPITAVISDDGAGVRQMFEHLLGLGHRRIAHIGGPQGTSTGRARRAAFQALAHAAGLAPEARLDITADAFTEAEGYRCARLMLETGERPSAVLAANDWLAIGAIRALEDLSLTCPQDVSVTGFNDMPFVDRMRPPLTTVRIPHYRMGYEAADHLLAAIHAPDGPPVRVVLPPTPVLRESTAAPVAR